MSNPKIIDKTPPPSKGFGHFNAFDPGTMSACIIALLKLERTYTEISNLYGEQAETQIKAIGTASDAVAASDIDKGNDQFWGTLDSAIGTAVSGTVDIAGGVGGLYSYGINSSELSEAKLDLQGAKSYLNKVNETSKVNAVMDDASSEKTSIYNDRINALKNMDRETKFYDPKTKTIRTPESQTIAEDEIHTDAEAIEHAEKTKELGAIKSNLEKIVEDKEKQYSSLLQDAQNKTTHITTIVRGLSQLPNAGGSVGQAIEQKEYGADDAELAYSQAGLQLAQGITDQLRKHGDEYFNQGLEVNQVLNQVNEANRMK